MSEDTETYWMRRALAADETIVKLEAQIEQEAGWNAEAHQTMLHLQSLTKRAEKIQADTIEVLNDCQAEMGRQCARADKAEWQLGEAFQDIRKTRVERQRLSSLRTLKQYVADLDRRWEERDG